MENLWTRINDKLPQYFERLEGKYKLEFVKISDLKTAIVGKQFALIIAIGRFNVDVFFAYKKNNDIEILQCGNFLAEKYSSEDRQNLLTGEGAENIIVNNLKVISSGLYSKWGKLLRGDLAWIDDYKKSKWYSHGNFTVEETELLWKLI